MHKKDRKQTCLLQSRWMRELFVHRDQCVCVCVCVRIYLCLHGHVCVHDRDQNGVMILLQFLSFYIMLHPTLYSQK